MIKDRDIIIVGIQPWDIEIGSNCKNIALEFAKHNRVLYVNAPLNWITRLKQKHKEKIKKRIDIAKGKRTDIELVEDNLWNLYPKTTIHSINWMNSYTMFKTFNKSNAKKFARDIKSAAQRLHFKDCLLFNDSSMFLGLHLKEYLNPEVYAYYIRDNLVKDPYWKKHGIHMEPRVMEAADVVVNNSEYYTAYSSKFNQNSFMVGQGCDVSMFNDVDGSIRKADELKFLKRPIIGYVGTLTTLRLDVELLAFIARQRKDWTIVLVGPEDSTFKESILHKIENIKFLGNKPMDTLPNYIKGFDVCINPQVLNEITIGNYPRKIDEYLAMGKPIVATYTKAMEMFDTHVYLGRTKEEYIALIEKALKEDTPEEIAKKRIEFANSHTWPNSVQNIYQAIEWAMRGKKMHHLTCKV